MNGGALGPSFEAGAEGRARKIGQSERVGRNMVSVTEDGVEFHFYRPGACKVYVAGDFNGWSVGPTPMVCSDGGHWFITVPLSPGTFRFRYVSDGQWFTDYAAFGVEAGPLGVNSVVYVGPRRRERVGVADRPASPAQSPASPWRRPVRQAEPRVAVA
jgi:1,4-alpha-glucan branching enzyme